MKVSDAELHEQVLRALESELDPGDQEVGIAVSGGVVILSGYVDAEEQARAVERVAIRVPGVAAVVQAARVGGKAERSRSDTAIAHRVANHLAQRLGSPESGLVARIEHGWVTLEGEVDLSHERSDAEESILGLLGVRGVSNHLTVRPPETVARIRAKIDAALNRVARPKALSGPDSGSAGNPLLAKNAATSGEGWEPPERGKG